MSEAVRPQAAPAGDQGLPHDLDMAALFQPDLLSGKVALVTGGGTGIGFVIARSFAQLGATVVVAARHLEPLERAVAGLSQAGGRAHLRQLDVRDPSAVASAVGAVVAEQGGLHILVNNAGGQFPVRAEELSPGGWRAVVDLNLTGTFNVCAAAGRHMIARGEGAIVNVVLTAPERPTPGMVHSGAARAGVVGMTRTLALEWARFGVRVNALAPLFLSDAARAVYGEEVAEVVAGSTPMRRWGSEAEIGACAVFLASPLSSYVTGVTLTADGGNSLGEGLVFRGSPVLPE